MRDVVRERLTKRQITKVQYSDTMSLLGGTVDYTGFGNVDLVIEAVFEDLNVKHEVLREVEAELEAFGDLRLEHEHHSHNADRSR